ncbi:hypothetical protein R3P38DRAFT_2792178 [Favolaschia claudopus]|uniref:Uncharacterized protein n=1 Tax=Favolaschia claudopus TaxID=2862362 RepID=A0AAW0AG56_9AGAR
MSALWHDNGIPHAKLSQEPTRGMTAMPQHLSTFSLIQVAPHIDLQPLLRRSRLREMSAVVNPPRGAVPGRSRPQGQRGRGNRGRGRGRGSSRGTEPSSGGAPAPQVPPESVNVASLDIPGSTVLLPALDLKDSEVEGMVEEKLEVQRGEDSEHSLREVSPEERTHRLVLEEEEEDRRKHKQMLWLILIREIPTQTQVAAVQMDSREGAVEDEAGVVEDFRLRRRCWGARMGNSWRNSDGMWRI